MCIRDRDKEEEDIQRGEDVLSKLEGINVDDPNLTDEDLQTALQEAGILDEEEQTPQAETEARPIKLAIVGRPNAGKSTLINTLLKSDRLLTGPEAGITRDSVSIDWIGTGGAFGSSTRLVYANVPRCKSAWSGCRQAKLFVH